MKTLLVALALLFSASLFASPKDCPYDNPRQCGAYYNTPGPGSSAAKRSAVHTYDTLIEGNMHVTKYAPSDISSGHGKYQRGGCTEDGFYSNDRSLTRRCQDFKSASEGTFWRVRFGQAGNAEYVFKLTNGNPQLWVKFKQGTQTAEFTSPGAQQYAAVNGGGGQIAGRGIPQVPQSAHNSACDQLSGKARAGCEAASGLLPNIGGLLKGW